MGGVLLIMVYCSLHSTAEKNKAPVVTLTKTYSLALHRLIRLPTTQLPLG